MLDKEERAFWSSVLEHWKALVGGSVVWVVALALYERFVQPLPWFAYVLVLLLICIHAGYLAWRDQYRRAKALQETGGFETRLAEASIAAVLPKAEVSIRQEGSTVLLYIKNTGAAALFYGTIRVAYGVVGLTGSDFVRWTHTDAVKTSIPRGAEFQAKLAELEWDTQEPRFAQWRLCAVRDNAGVIDAPAIYSSSSPVSGQGAKAPDLKITGLVLAEPDLRDGPVEYEVDLGPFGMKNARIGARVGTAS